MWTKCAVLLALSLCISLSTAVPAESTLTYQGYVEDNGQPLNNTSAEMRFRLYDADSGGVQQGPEIVKAPGDVSFDEGLFTTELDFGTGPFNGTQLWLEIEIEGDVLSPRTKLTASAYSLSTRGITVDADGDVGIGIADPVSALHVDGDVESDHFRARGGGNLVQVYNPNNEDASFFLGWLNDIPRIRIGGSGPGGNGGFDIQRIGDSSLFRVSNDRNIGISEPNPDLRLTFNQQGLGIDDPSSHTLSFHTNGAERMRLSSAGLLGINTNSPATYLDVDANNEVLPSGAQAAAEFVYVTGLPIPGAAPRTDKSTVDIVRSGGLAGTVALDVSASEAGAARFVSDENTGPTVDIQNLQASTALKLLSFSGNGPILDVEMISPGSSFSQFAVFRTSAGGNVARIDRNGRGYFNDGTQNSGADVAEFFAVEGTPSDYQPGDVLVISTRADRTVARSTEPYCTLVAGVHATKPGVLLSERGIDEDHSDMVPMGVVGVVPTKVSTENGAIRRGDLLVSSSTPGHAMKGTDRDRLVGAIIGKALEGFDGIDSDTGVIRVMVTCK